MTAPAGALVQSVAAPSPCTVMTVQGLGASLSPALGGWLAQNLGYPTMFLILGSFALVSIALWVGFSSVLKPACASKQAEPPVGLAGAKA
jgi:hypothetical protein